MDNPQIVLIDDRSDDVALTLDALAVKHLDQRVTVFGEAAGAIDYLVGGGIHNKRDIGVQPQVVLLALDMQHMDAFQVLKQLRKHRATRNVPIVALMSSDTPAEIRRARRAGANSYLRKPVVFAEFVKVSTALGLDWTHLTEAMTRESGARGEPWHSNRPSDRRVYHNSPVCTEAQGIPPTSRAKGTGGLPRCLTCKRLSGEYREV